MSAERRYEDLPDEAELDLVKIAPTAKPPVCKIIDYGKVSLRAGHEKRRRPRRSRGSLKSRKFVLHRTLMYNDHEYQGGFRQENFSRRETK